MSPTAEYIFVANNELYLGLHNLFFFVSFPVSDPHLVAECLN